MNAEYIAKKLEAITVIQNGETTKPLQEFADFVRQQQAEIEALKKQVEVLSKAFETACDGMQTSLELNKAQAERYWSEKK